MTFCCSKSAKSELSIPLFPSGNSIFSLGLSFGIMFMMSARKAEIDELNKTMDETAKLVQELKSELNRRKSSRAHENLDSVGNSDMNSRKMSGRHELMLTKTNSELRDSGECGSSTLTEESEPGVLEMDQLEAELEFELQKLSGCTIDSHRHEEIKPELEKVNFLGSLSFVYPTLLI